MLADKQQARDLPSSEDKFELLRLGGQRRCLIRYAGNRPAFHVHPPMLKIQNADHPAVLSAGLRFFLIVLYRVFFLAAELGSGIPWRMRARVSIFAASDFLCIFFNSAEY